MKVRPEKPKGPEGYYIPEKTTPVWLINSIFIAYGIFLFVIIYFGVVTNG